MTPDQPLRRAWGSHVSRVLGRAGFTRATVETSSLGNMNYYTPGFEVRGSNQSWEVNLLTTEERDAGCVTVERSIMDTHRHEENDPRSRDERRDDDLAAYLDVLESSGFEVEDRRNRIGGHWLVVRGRH